MILNELIKKLKLNEFSKIKMKFKENYSFEINLDKEEQKMKLLTGLFKNLNNNSNNINFQDNLSKKVHNGDLNSLENFIKNEKIENLGENNNNILTIDFEENLTNKILSNFDFLNGNLTKNKIMIKNFYLESLSSFCEYYQNEYLKKERYEKNINFENFLNKILKEINAFANKSGLKEQRYFQKKYFDLIEENEKIKERIQNIFQDTEKSSLFDTIKKISIQKINIKLSLKKIKTDLESLQKEKKIETIKRGLEIIKNNLNKKINDLDKKFNKSINSSIQDNISIKRYELDEETFLPFFKVKNNEGKKNKSVKINLNKTTTYYFSENMSYDSFGGVEDLKKIGDKEVEKYFSTNNEPYFGEFVKKFSEKNLGKKKIDFLIQKKGKTGFEFSGKKEIKENALLERKVHFFLAIFKKFEIDKEIFEGIDFDFDKFGEIKANIKNLIFQKLNYFTEKDFEIKINEIEVRNKNEKIIFLENIKRTVLIKFESLKKIINEKGILKMFSDAKNDFKNLKNEYNESISQLVIKNKDLEQRLKNFKNTEQISNKNSENFSDKSETNLLDNSEENLSLSDIQSFSNLEIKKPNFEEDLNIESPQNNSKSSKNNKDSDTLKKNRNELDKKEKNNKISSENTKKEKISNLQKEIKNEKNKKNFKNKIKNEKDKIFCKNNPKSFSFSKTNPKNDYKSPKNSNRKNSLSISENNEKIRRVLNLEILFSDLATEKQNEVDSLKKRIFKIEKRIQYLLDTRDSYNEKILRNSYREKNYIKILETFKDESGYNFNLCCKNLNRVKKKIDILKFYLYKKQEDVLGVRSENLKLKKENRLLKNEIGNIEKGIVGDFDNKTDKEKYFLKIKNIYDNIQSAENQEYKNLEKNQKRVYNKLLNLIDMIVVRKFKKTEEISLNINSINNSETNKKKLLSESLKKKDSKSRDSNPFRRKFEIQKKNDMKKRLDKLKKNYGNINKKKNKSSNLRQAKLLQSLNLSQIQKNETEYTIKNSQEKLRNSESKLNEFKDIINNNKESKEVIDDLLKKLKKIKEEKKDLEIQLKKINPEKIKSDQILISTENQKYLNLLKKIHKIIFKLLDKKKKSSAFKSIEEIPELLNFIQLRFENYKNIIFSLEEKLESKNKKIMWPNDDNNANESSVGNFNENDDVFNNLNNGVFNNENNGVFNNENNSRNNSSFNENEKSGFYNNENNRVFNNEENENDKNSSFNENEKNSSFIDHEKNSNFNHEKSSFYNNEKSGFDNSKNNFENDFDNYDEDDFENNRRNNFLNDKTGLNNKNSSVEDFENTSSKYDGNNSHNIENKSDGEEVFFNKTDENIYKKSGKNYNKIRSQNNKNINNNSNISDSYENDENDSYNDEDNFNRSRILSKKENEQENSDSDEKEEINAYISSEKEPLINFNEIQYKNDGENNNNNDNGGNSNFQSNYKYTKTNLLQNNNIILADFEKNDTSSEINLKIPEYTSANSQYKRKNFESVNNSESENQNITDIENISKFSKTSKRSNSLNLIKSESINIINSSKNINKNDSNQTSNKKSLKNSIENSSKSSNHKKTFKNLEKIKTSNPNFEEDYKKEQKVVQKAFDELITNIFKVTSTNLDFIQKIESLILNKLPENENETFTETQKADHLNTIFELDKLKNNNLQLKDMLECLYDNLMDFLNDMDDLNLGNDACKDGGKINEVIRENNLLYEKLERGNRFLELVRGRFGPFGQFGGRALKRSRSFDGFGAFDRDSRNFDLKNFDGNFNCEDFNYLKGKKDLKFKIKEFLKKINLSNKEFFLGNGDLEDRSKFLELKEQVKILLNILNESMMLTNKENIDSESKIDKLKKYFIDIHKMFVKKD